LEAKLADPALYGRGLPEEITQANTRLATIAREEQSWEESWLKAQEELEKMST
jgi:hypothetical protein